MGTTRRIIPQPPPVALLTHRPDPGLYSRLERAVEKLPKEVRIDGLANRLRKSPEGVSSWELGPVMESLFQSEESFGKTIPRNLLLGHVRKASPALTHKESVLHASGPNRWDSEGMFGSGSLGQGPLAGTPEYGGHSEPWSENYREILLQQPNASKISAQPIDGERAGVKWDGGHWGGFPDTIAHARIADRGDALRVIELQSDVRNQNISNRPGGDIWDPNKFPLYDHYPEVMLKGILLRAAREGKRAIEIPDFGFLERNTGMRPAGVQHVYGGQVPGTLIRAARPLGGLIDAGPQPAPTRLPQALTADQQYRSYLDGGYSDLWMERDAAKQAILRPIYDALPNQDRNSFNDWRWSPMGLSATPDDIVDSLRAGGSQISALRRLRANALRQAEAAWATGPLDADKFNASREAVERAMPQSADAMQRFQDLMDSLGRVQALYDQYEPLPLRGKTRQPVATSRRLVIPDSVRRRIIEGGIGLSVLQGLMAEPQPSQEQR